MSRFDHTAFVNSRRDERSLGHHTLRAYAQDLRDELGAKPATIERRLVTLKSYYA